MVSNVYCIQNNEAINMLQTRIVSIIGSEDLQETSDVGQILKSICERLVILGFSLRTSGTEGTEMIALNVYKEQIEQGIIPPTRLKVFLPWRGFNTVLPYPQCYTTVGPKNYDLCSNFIRSVHSYWAKGTRQTKLLQAKNALIIFGEKLNRPCDLVIAYAELDNKGKVVGTASSAIELATVQKIPVFNLWDQENLETNLFELRTLLRNWGYPVVTEENVVFM